MKLKKIRAEMAIRTTPEKMWEVLSRYGDVYRFHAGARNPGSFIITFLPRELRV